LNSQTFKLFHDPVYDDAADPTVVWHRKGKKWFMFYTNRRANAPGLDGVTWVHGTRISIAESSDGGATWNYRDTCDIRYRPYYGYTHWAPEVVENKGTYHMFLTYVPGVFSDWSHPRRIVHLTSKNLISISLISDRLQDIPALQIFHEQGEVQSRSQNWNMKMVRLSATGINP
jgi:hypothetical protein